MRSSLKWFSRSVEFMAATMLAAMFLTFLLQIFSRYVLWEPFGWTLELCLILWVWIVFFGCAFLVREKDHVTFDIFYFAAPRGLRVVFVLISCGVMIVALGSALLPTWDYIDWMKIRKTMTVKNPLTGSKIPMRTVFSVYGIFMCALMLRYGWMFYQALRNRLPDEAHSLPRFKPGIPEDEEEKG